MVKIAYCQATYSRDLEETKLCIQRVSPYVDCTIISYDQSVSDSQLKWFEDNRDKYKLESVRYEFVDNLPEMRNSYLDKAKELGMDWIVVSDPDELYSEELCKGLRELIEKYNFEGYNMIGIPCRDDFINKLWLDELDLAKEQPGGVETDFWKPILVLKISGTRSDIRYEGVGKEKNVHETVVSVGRVKSINLDKKYYYTHRKNALKVWRNAARNMFIGGGGDNVGDENTLWVRLRDICNEMGIKDWISFEKFVEKGMDWWLREKEKEIKLGGVSVSLEEKKKEIEDRLQLYIENQDKGIKKLGLKPFVPGSIEYEEMKKKETERLNGSIEDIIKDEKIERLRDLIQQFESWMIEALQAGSNSWQTETRETAKFYYAMHPEDVDDFILGFIEKMPDVVSGSDTEITNFVSRTYFEVLGRHPDAKGKALYVGKIKDGMVKREELAGILRDSQEYREKFKDIDRIGGNDRIGGGGNDKSTERFKDVKVDIKDLEMVEKFIRECYANILGRTVDQPGLQNYIDLIMNEKMKPEELVGILKNSNEYKQKFGMDELGRISDDRFGCGENKEKPSPFIKSSRSRGQTGFGFDLGGKGREILDLDSIDASRFNTVGLCIMTPSNDIRLAMETIKIIGSVCDEIHVQSDSFKDSQIMELKEIGKNIGRDVEIHIVEWKDDFGDYKNKVCGHSRTEWVLILDHDEVPSMEIAKKLREIILKSDRGNNFDQITFDVIDEIWHDGLDGSERRLLYQNRNKGGKALLHWNIPNPYFGDLHIWLKQNYYPWKTIHAPYAYIHIKTKDEILERSARNVILGGGGDTVKEGNPLWRELTNLRISLGLDSWTKTNEYLKKGGIDDRMIKIFEDLTKLKWKDEELRDLKKYYLKLHPMEMGRF